MDAEMGIPRHSNYMGLESIKIKVFGIEYLEVYDAACLHVSSRRVGAQVTVNDTMGSAVGSRVLLSLPIFESSRMKPVTPLTL